MITKWKRKAALAASALIGVTAIAFASDFITANPSVPKPFVTGLAHNDEACPPGECSIVVKANADEPSAVILQR